MNNGTRFSPKLVNQTLREIFTLDSESPKRAWLRAIGTHCVSRRPDLEEVIIDYLGVPSWGEDILLSLRIEELSVCYEALVAQTDSELRRGAGQYFTPGDAASFMAKHALEFPAGSWIDPCSGLGVLSWHLVSELEAAGCVNPPEFVRERLTLCDLDEVALKSAVVLIAAEYLEMNDTEGFRRFAERSVVADFLDGSFKVESDYAILNPPYSRVPENSLFRTGPTRDLYAYFLEKIATATKGFIAVTPASFLGTPKFASVRRVFEDVLPGGRVYVFDNVPDTLFRGFKFGSSNTSQTNFVRAAITISYPGLDEWSSTPIVRWKSASRKKMFEHVGELLAPLKKGPNGEWLKIHPNHVAVWEEIQTWRTRLSDLTTARPTQYHLTVATTPRYFISASFSPLRRRSQATLYFPDEKARDLAAIALNSSVPYLWWRWLDGGVTLTKRVLLSTPMPPKSVVKALVVEKIRASEEVNRVVKLNAGVHNENIKHPPALVRELDGLVIDHDADVTEAFSEDMFAHF